MDTRGSRRTRVSKVATQRDEDEPHIRPIPMQPLEEEDEEDADIDKKTSDKPSTDQKIINVKKESSQVNSGCKINLDIVYNNLKAEHFQNRNLKQPLHTLKPRHRVKMKINIDGGLKMEQSVTEQSENKPIQLNKSKVRTMYVMEAIREMKSKLTAYLGKKPITFEIDAERSTMTRSMSSVKAAYLKAFTGKRPAEDPEFTPWKHLAEFMKFGLKTHKSWSDLQAHATKWEEMRLNPESVKKYSVSQDKIAEMFGITVEEVKSFEFHKDRNLFDMLSKNSHRCIVPDLMKQLAFSSWQTSAWEKCDYYLSEAQAKFLHHDIMDRHSAFACRAEEWKSTGLKERSVAVKANDERRKHVFQLQSSDLKTFGPSMEEFKRNRELINPDWHIVQVSSLFHCHNRFGGSISARPKSPALFLSAYTTINGQNTRYAYTTYVADPKLDPGVTKLGISEHMLSILTKNANINGAALMGQKQLYWNIRAEHNDHMQVLTRFLEEGWIYPWSFLFPGNIQDKETISQITDILDDIWEAYKSEFTYRTKGVLYKLIENYNVLDEKLKSTIEVLVAHILNVPIDETLVHISKKIAELGATIKLDSPRTPTILVLDQGLEQFPWECMPCMRNTSTDVTRVPSLAMIYSLMRINEFRQEDGDADIDVDKCTFVLNPDGSLKNVESRFKKYFGDRKKWSGYIQTKPPSAEIERAIEHQELLLYCGHGSGSSIFQDNTLQKLVCRSVPLLMGCASARVTLPGPKVYGSSAINSYFAAACRGMVGFLWEITDLECDRLTADIVERIAPDPEAKLPDVFNRPVRTRPYEPSLPACVRLCRSSASQYMTHAAIVYYGIPLKGKKQITNGEKVSGDLS